MKHPPDVLRSNILMHVEQHTQKVTIVPRTHRRQFVPWLVKEMQQHIQQLTSNIFFLLHLSRKIGTAKLQTMWGYQCTVCN